LLDSAISSIPKVSLRDAWYSLLGSGDRINGKGHRHLLVALSSELYEGSRCSVSVWRFRLRNHRCRRHQRRLQGRFHQLRDSCGTLAAGVL